MHHLLLSAVPWVAGNIPYFDVKLALLNAGAAAIAVLTRMLPGSTKLKKVNTSAAPATRGELKVDYWSGAC